MPRISLPWLEPGASFPPVANAWGPGTDAPGLLAAGGDLTPETLVKAYSSGIFPWYSGDQPILWWSPDPRMVLRPVDFRVHRSMRKTLKAFQSDPGCEIRFDSAFSRVIEHCAQSPRVGQNGTWIVPKMVSAYEQLHAHGYAHSVETWVNGELVGGLYCVAIGKAVFGESMFARATDASKIALSALVAFCAAHGVRVIDCQQNTRHLASLGAAEVSRDAFCAQVREAQKYAALEWTFMPLYWNAIQSAE